MEIRKGKLFFDGCDTTELAKEWGTPVYLLSENKILEKTKEIRKEFLDKYENTRAAYAAKAFLTAGFCKLIEKEGLCLDVVSVGELYTAIKAEFPAERIEFNGNNKTDEELEMAISYGVGRIIIDDAEEIDRIHSFCEKLNKKTAVLIRVTPGVSADTHAYISTGHTGSKFGIPLEESGFWEIIEKAIKDVKLDFLGYHFHIGSQLFDNKTHIEALEKTLELVKETKKRFNFDIREINIGGGFGVKYTDSDLPKSFSYFLDPVMKRLDEFCKEIKIKRPAVVIEPGRSVVAEAGMTLYTAGTVKRLENGKTWLSVDGGMTDNIRPALYQAKYDAVIANKATEEKTEIVTICGKCCESGDILIEDIKVPTPKRGDIIAVFSTGAYGYSMANNYNKIAIPPVVMLNNGKSRLIVKRQSLDDLISREIL